MNFQPFAFWFLATTVGSSPPFLAVNAQMMMQRKTVSWVDAKGWIGSGPGSVFPMNLDLFQLGDMFLTAWDPMG